MIILARKHKIEISRRRLVLFLGVLFVGGLALVQISVALADFGIMAVLVAVAIVFVVLKLATRPLSRVISRTAYSIRWKFEVAIASVAALFLVVSLVHLSSMDYMHDELHEIQDLMDGSHSDPEKRAEVRPTIAALEDTHHGLLFRMIPIISVLGVGGAAALGAAMAWSVIFPVRKMGAAMGRIGAGDFSQPIDVENRDELGDLSQSINRTASKLAGLQEAVLAEERGRALRERNTHVAMAEEEERRRISRELHDGLGPSLAAVGNRIRAARHVLRTDPEEAEKRLDDIAEGVKGHVREIRELIYDLRPLALDQLGLVGALEHQMGRVGHDSGVGVSFDHSGEGDLNPLAEVTVFRVVQECLSNIQAHADARQVEVALGITESGLEVSVEDDGRGFDPANTTPNGFGKGLGLLSMQERAERLGGRLTVESSPGDGCRVLLYIPLGEVAVGADKDPSG